MTPPGTFKANGGATDSNVATITLTILTNSPPAGNNGTLTTAEDKSANRILRRIPTAIA